MAEDAGVRPAPRYFTKKDEEDMVNEYEYIAHLMGVRDYTGTHREHAENMIRTGDHWQLKHQIRKLWGKD